MTNNMMCERKRWVVLLRVWLVMVCGMGGQYAAASELEPLDATPRLVVMSAFDAEMTNLLAEADIRDTYLIHGNTFHVGTLAGNEIVLALSGVSMVNAAMTTQMVIDHFTVTGIVFSGIAGGVNPHLHVGDVTVPAQWGQYQEQLFAREVSPGIYDTNAPVTLLDPPTNFGMMFPKLVPLVTQQPDGEPVEEYKLWFPVDITMLQVIRAMIASRQVSEILANCTVENACLQHAPQIVLGGNGVSGQTFTDNKDYREWVWKTFQADALDMETAAVAHVAYVNQIPYIAFRSLSDLAGGGPGANEIGIFFQVAANNSSALLLEFLKEWAQQR